MHILNNYRLEYRVEKNRKLYDVCTIVSPILRIIAVVQILPAILVSLYFIIGIVLCVALSFVFDRLSIKSIYTIKFEWNEGFFYIIKLDLDGKETIMEEIVCREAKDICICDEIDSLGKNYVATDKAAQKENLLVKIDYKGQMIYTSMDEYMYALLCKGREYGLFR